MPTKLPDDFIVTEQIKEWSLKKYGYYDLPNYFVSDFRAHFAAKGTQYDDWSRAFQNWINWSAPSGRFYNADVWENALNKCKAMMNAEKPKIEVPVKTFQKMTKPKSFDILREQLRAQLKEETMKQRPEPDSLPDEVAGEQRQRFINEGVRFDDLEDKTIWE